MPDYKALYFKLFSAQSEAIELLQKAALMTEDIVMNDDNAPVSLPGMTEEEDGEPDASGDKKGSHA